MNIIIKNVVLDKIKNPATGFTKQYVGGEVASVPCVLQIESILNKSEGKEYIYLIHYDSGMKEITDTQHDTVELAMEQARLEFNVQKNNWQDIK